MEEGSRSSLTNDKGSDECGEGEEEKRKDKEKWEEGRGEERRDIRLENL